MGICKIFYLFILIVISGCSNSFRSISKEVQEKQGSGKIQGISFHDVRLKLNRTGKLSFLKTADTIFFLESYIPEEGRFDGSIWTAKDSIHYSYNYKGFSFLVPQFTAYTLSAIGKWDINAITENESLYSNINPHHQVYGIRIIKNQNITVIDTISFRRFINVDRDRLNCLPPKQKSYYYF